MENQDKDLPLMSNTDDILVFHYIFDLNCSFSDKVVSGAAILFLKPVLKQNVSNFKNTNAKIIDSCHEKQESLTLPEFETGSENINFKSSKNLSDKNTLIVLEEKNSNSLLESNKDKTFSLIRDVNITKCDNKLKDDFHGQDESTPVSSHDNTTLKSRDGQMIYNSKIEQKCSSFLNENQVFKVILDCCKIDITSVEQIDVTDQMINSFEQFKIKRESVLLIRKLIGKLLHFNVDAWSLKIWKEDVYYPEDFPKVIRIRYNTRPEGPSLKWTFDQNKKLCAFTEGVWINNRSLFPCQEPPVAMATWQANFIIPRNVRVVMSGDNCGEINEEDTNDTLSYYYYTTMQLPMSTFALAMGYWDVIELIPSSLSQDICNIYSSCQRNEISCKIIGPSSVIFKAQEEFSGYIFNCLDAACKILGLYPFLRLDIVFLPRCFASLGLANPNLIFLSQNVLSGDGSMCIRLAHEISHSWFGLIIGAIDWTEEWLSEGFATYMEDIIHSHVLKWSEVESKEHAELRAYLRYRTLSAELQNTEEKLQILRPAAGEKLTDLSNSVVYVKNGLNPEKAFTQVHYLKGYFLLRYMANFVGQRNFEQLLRKYVERYHGQLVHSQEIFNIFFETFPHVKSCHGIDAVTLYKSWLDYSGMPQPLQHYLLNSENKLYAEVLCQVDIWKHLNHSIKRTKVKKKRQKLSFDGLKQLEADQLVLLLELLLEESSIQHQILLSLKTFYQLEKKNSDVRHRWCEMIIKYNYKLAADDIKKFLFEDQAMGIYLYGELILSGHNWQHNLAEECFKSLEEEMDSNSSTIVKEMLYGGESSS